MKKKGNKLLIFLIIILLIIGVGCLSYFIYMQMKYQHVVDEYNTIAENFTTDPTDDPDSTNSDLNDEDDDLVIDWNGLKAQNQDVVGWIVMSPSVNYPIVQGSDNNEYLHKNFNGDYEFAGCIFMNCDNSSDFTDKNTILYGHNMRNGSMFGDLDYFYTESYATDNPYIYIYTPNGKFTYKITRDLITEDGSAVYTTGILKNDTFNQYLSDCLNVSSVNYIISPDLSSNDFCLTLSTCVHASGSDRHVVQARLEKFEISEEEKKKMVEEAIENNTDPIQEETGTESIDIVGN